MTNVLYVQLFLFFIITLFLFAATRLKTPFSEFSIVAAMLVAGIALSNLWFLSIGNAVGEIIMLNAQLLYWTGLLFGAITFLGAAEGTIANFIQSMQRR